MLLLFINSL